MGVQLKSSLLSLIPGELRRLSGTTELFHTEARGPSFVHLCWSAIGCRLPLDGGGCLTSQAFPARGFQWPKAVLPQRVQQCPVSSQTPWHS